MAEVGIFQRLANLWRGFLSIWISNVEKEHPEIAYENAINSMVEKYSKLKAATAAIIRRREDIDERLKGPEGAGSDRRRAERRRRDEPGRPRRRPHPAEKRPPRPTLPS
jgi:phage shock protein A